MDHAPSRRTTPPAASVLSCLLIGFLLAAVPGRPAQADGPRVGTWRAALECPGGPIEFGLEWRRAGETWAAILVNGRERAAVPGVVVDGDRVRLEFTQYGSHIDARLSADGRRLEGTWERRRGADLWTRMPFRARIDESGAATVSAAMPRDLVAGRWAVDFSSSEEPAVGVFEAGEGSPGAIVGTFLTTVGDYRFLGGRVTEDGRGLRLNVFDGAHAFLFTASLQEDGTLTGDFWSRDAWHDTWTATRDPDAALPDGFGLTAWNPAVDLGDLRFPTPGGTLVALDDAQFAGRPLIIDVFGTWCPNCNDATRLLVDLHRRYRDQGLQVLGLAFEYTGDPAIDAERVRAYRAHHDIDFPILIAGTTDKVRASAALPFLDRVRAYPTLVFMDPDGSVRAILTGFNGPATGALHEKQREDVDRIVAEMLAARLPDAPRD